MAKRRKKSNAVKALKRRNALWQHIWQISRQGENGYLAWCAQNGFAVTTDKSVGELRQELKIYRDLQTKVGLQRSRLARNPAPVVAAVCARQLEPERIASHPLREAMVAMSAASDDDQTRRSLADFVIGLLSKTNLPLAFERFGAGEQSYMLALVAMHRLRARWIRSPATWQPRSHSRRRQFESLLDHLLIRYRVPAFFEDVWFRQDELAPPYQRWCVDVAQGARLRDGPLPVPLTRKAAHAMAQAPAGLCIEHAVRFGQIKALDGSLALTRAVVQTRLGASFAHDAFWQSVLRFFVANADLELKDVGPIIDFLQHHKFEGQEEVLENGQTRALPPPQPNLSMHRRTLPALLSQVDQWHRRLGKVKAHDGLRWPPCGLRPAQFVVGKDEERVVWRIAELLSHKQLVREGSSQRHCVASYAQDCRDGRCSIWSVSSEDVSGKVRRRLTLEVTRERCIVQCRGRMNKIPREDEAQMVRRWAAAESLTIDAYGF